MGFFDPVLRSLPLGRMAGVKTSQDLYELLTGGWLESKTGVKVNHETAMRAITVNTCRRLISGLVGSISVDLFRKVDERTKERATDHYLFDKFHDEPNGWQNAMGYFETVASHVLMRGNHYSLKTFVNGRLDELIPIHPDLVTPKLRSDGSRVYEIRKQFDLPGPEGVLPQELIFHVCGLTENGWVGRSVLSDIRETVGMQLAEEQFRALFFKQRAKHGLVVTLPKRVRWGSTEHKDIRDGLAKGYGDLSQSWKSLLLENDMTANTVSMTLDEAQFLQQIQATKADIGAFFVVPLFLIGLTEKQTGWGAGIEQQMIAMKRFTIGCVTRRIELSIKTQLLDEPDLVAKFNLDNLSMTDLKGTVEALAREFQNGAITLNEWRHVRNRNPYTEDFGDKAFIQMNLANPDQFKPLGEGQNGQQ